MSYILDALTKSQQQRRQGDVATPGTPQWMPDPAKAARARYWNGALIVLAIAAVLFAVHVLTRQDEGAEVAPRTAADAPAGAAPAATMTAPSRETELSPTTPEPDMPPARSVVQTPSASPPASEARRIARAPGAPETMPTAPPGPARRSDIPLTETPIASPPRQAAPASGPLRSEASSAAETAAEGVAADPLSGARESVDPATVKLAEELLDLARRSPPRPAPGNVFPQPPATSDAGSRPEPEEAAESAAPSSPDSEMATAAAKSPTVARSEAMPAAAPDLPGGDVLPSMRALPSEVQTSLGRLSINAHVYSDVPAGRMVIINMNRYLEGDKLREGPRVETITARGAILSYETYRFHLSLR